VCTSARSKELGFIGKQDTLMKLFFFSSHSLFYAHSVEASTVKIGVDEHPNRCARDKSKTKGLFLYALRIAIQSKSHEK
jgi:hypothetical protein